VEGSLKTLTSDERWTDLRLGTWYLVTPWDPTPEAYNWFKELAEKYKVTAVWHGLTYIEQLVAKYPDVVDYYLHGGATRIEAAYQAVMALDRVDRDGEALEVPEVVRRIQKALPSLDTDPHYRYELRFGEGQLPTGLQRPGLVMTTIVGQGKAGRWAAVDVIARCAASTAVRPITITGKFVVDSGDAFAEALSDFHAFGVPFTSPEGVYEGEIDAPGGLGGRLEGATVTSFAATDDLGDNPELHLEVLDPAGAVLASADVERVERSEGAAGVRVVLQEVNGIFTLEDQYNLKERTGSRNIRLGGFTGAPVTAAHAALTFLIHCKSQGFLQGDHVVDFDVRRVADRDAVVGGVPLAAGEHAQPGCGEDLAGVVAQQHLGAGVAEVVVGVGRIVEQVSVVAGAVLVGDGDGGERRTQ
jgi:hypothetical protein